MDSSLVSIHSPFLLHQRYLSTSVLFCYPNGEFCLQDVGESADLQVDGTFWKSLEQVPGVEVVQTVQTDIVNSQ